MEVEVSRANSQFAVHAILDVERKQDQGTLPSFNLFKGFGSIFSGEPGSKEKAVDK